MKVLIVGSKGMAGHLIRDILIKSGLEVIDISRTNEFFESTYTLDLTNLQYLEQILSKETPDVVVNCAGVLNQNAESNPEQSVFVNSYLPHFLASRSKRLLHISTDCVFSGKKGNYVESDVKDGLGVYATSKSLGEVNYGPHLTLRTSIIGPELKTDGIGLLHWVLHQSGTVNGYSNAFWSGVTTLELAKAVLKFIGTPQITGLLHYSNNVKIDKFHLLEIINTVFMLGLEIDAYPDYHVDKSLLHTRKDIKLDIPSYEVMIKELYDFMLNNKTGQYKQYLS